MVLKRLPYAFVLASLMITCSKKDSNKRQDPLPPPVAGAACAELAEGQQKSFTYYKKARAAWNETCTSLALQVTATCDKGKLLIQGEGYPACDETILSKLAIRSASTTLKVNGAPLALTLEGADQDGQTFVIDNSQAAWTSSSEQVTVNAEGLATAKAAVNDVARHRFLIFSWPGLWNMTLMESKAEQKHLISMIFVPSCATVLEIFKKPTKDTASRAKHASVNHKFRLLYGSTYKISFDENTSLRVHPIGVGRFDVLPSIEQYTPKPDHGMRRLGWSCRFAALSNC